LQELLKQNPLLQSIEKFVESFFIEKVIPAIKEKWPRYEIGQPIFIQQDNARCHVNEDDIEFRQAVSQDGFDIWLMCRPPNSQEPNVSDLGSFSVIQSMQHKETPKTIDDLVAAVKKSFEIFPSELGNKIFISLQTYMVEIMKTKGLNKSSVPHIKKNVTQRQGQLSVSIRCDPSLVDEVLDHLNSR
jgi:hypothetical protein